MHSGTTLLSSATWLRALSAPGRRRPAALRVGVFLSLLPLLAACTDITRPTAQVTTPILNMSSGDGPVIATDKADYGPGETVVIDGWGWTAGETVHLQVAHVNEEGDNSLPEHQPWDVTANENGEIAATWLVPVDGDEGGATLKLTADGGTSTAHAEVTFTDLTGQVHLFSNSPTSISQSAFAWGATIYPRLTSGTTSRCYRFQWRNPSDVVVGVPAIFKPAAGATYDAPSFTIPATGPSGQWSLLADQAVPAGDGTCNAGLTWQSPADPILFDVARAVVIGAGTTADDPIATTGDQCVAQINAPSGGCGATSTSIWVRSQSGDNVRSFLRFDLSTASPAAVPAGVNVTNAKVRLTVIGTPGTQRTHNIQRAAAPWDEGLATFAVPATVGAIGTATVLTTLTAGAGGGDQQTWVKWTVTADVQGFVSGSFANDGWRISDASEGGPLATTRFSSTENTCTVGTTCKRLMPVLLIDYTDPPKLTFYTTAKTGIVGQCLGPIQVQSKDFSGAVLPVSGDVTVNLTTANLGVGDGAGAAGAGSFFSNGTCTTITTGNSISAAFYYRATERGDGGHDVVASATDYTPNPSQTETINKAPTTLTYTGDRLVLVGNTFNFSGTISSPFEPCTENKRVLFRILPSPLDQSDAFLERVDFSDIDGVAVASAPTTGWIEDIYDGRMSTNLTDDNCLVSKDDYTVSVLTPGGAATGGGFLAGNKVGGGRVNFGFTIRPIEGSDPIAYKGQFLLIKQVDNVPVFRCKGAIDTYGTVSGSTPLLNVASGRCDFQVWNPALNGGEGGWVVPYGAGYTNRQFIFQFIDNGTGRGSNAPPPDEFGFNINFVGSVITDPSFVRAPINGGNIDVKTGGTTTTTTTKGGGKKGG
jgi:hypothetical protein